MGNSASKNKTHPLHQQEMRGLNYDMVPRYDLDQAYDPRIDYDSGYYEGKHYGQSYKHHPDNNPISKRSCTDVICFLLFLAFLGGWAVVAYFGIQGGDIDKIIYPTDSDGYICGRDRMEGRSYLMMFDLSQCLNPAVLVSGCSTPHICVEKCPSENYFPLGESKLLGHSEDDIKKEMKSYCKLMKDEDYNNKSVSTLVSEGLCPPWYLSSSAVLGRCLPTPTSFDESVTSRDTDDKDDEVVVPKNDTQQGNKDLTKKDLKTGLFRLGAFLQLRQIGESVFEDLNETWYMIGIALVGACILSFIWIILMRFLASIMVWTSILIVFLGTGSLTGYCGYRLFFAYKDEDAAAAHNIFQLNWTPEIVDDFLKQRDTWIAFTSVSGIIFLVTLCLFIFLRKRILIAIALIEEGSKAVGHMFSSLFFPIIPWLFQVVVAGWFLFVALYLASSGEQEFKVVIQDNDVNNNSNPCDGIQECLYTTVNNTQEYYKGNDSCVLEEFSACRDACPRASCQFVKYIKNKDYSWMQFINVFGLYWGIFFFAAFGEMVLAGVYAQWYWAPKDNKNKKRIPSCALGTAMWNTSVFHLGTIAFGSLIISIIRMIRTILEYVERKCRKYNNDLTKCIICCCKCCLWCLEKFMRFINRNAYIMCAIKSTNFCKSAMEAFNLIMRNLVRVVVLDSVVDFLLFLGKLVIVLITGAASYLAFSGNIPDIKEEIPSLNYYYTPVVFIVVGSYIIASSFFGVYAMAVDTLFLCFLEDLERNDGSPEKPYYMSKNLKTILGKMEQTAHETRFSRSPYN